jgi:hypothetical protein
MRFSEEERRKGRQAFVKAYREGQRRQKTQRAEERRMREAHSRVAWDYKSAIDLARRDKPERLISLFKTRVVPDGKEWDLLARFVSDLFPKPGGQAKEATHRTAVLVRALKEIGLTVTDEALRHLCKRESRESGEPVSPEAVRTLVRDPKRLQPKSLQHE